MFNLKRTWAGFKTLTWRQKIYALFLVPGFYLWAVVMLALAFTACILKMPYDIIYGAKWYRRHCPKLILPDGGLLEEFRKN